MNGLKILIIALFMHIVFSAHTFYKIVLDSSQALCLDGSKGAFYVLEGIQKTKFLISFEDGEWCGSSKGLSQTLDDCYARSSTSQGSSLTYPITVSYSSGILGDEQANPFKDWTKLYLKYCDGTGHQGYKKDSIVYKGKKLNFRGNTIVLQQLKSINSKFKLETIATDIIVTGSGSGGLAAFIWANYIKSIAPQNANVRLISDSSIFLDSMNVITKRNNFRQLIQNFMKISNIQINSPNKECINGVSNNQKWKCLFVQYNYQYIKVPMFIIQSLYDSWSLINILGINCQKQYSLQQCKTAQMVQIERYHTNITVILKLIGKNKNNGYWAPACSNHGYTMNGGYVSIKNKIPYDSIYTVSRSVSDWVSQTNISNEHIDIGNWPVNKPCSGLPDSDHLTMQ